jgi:hypothetical protein
LCGFNDDSHGQHWSPAHWQPWHASMADQTMRRSLVGSSSMHHPAMANFAMSPSGPQIIGLALPGPQWPQAPHPNLNHNQHAQPQHSTHIADKQYWSFATAKDRKMQWCRVHPSLILIHLSRLTLPFSRSFPRKPYQPSAIRSERSSTMSVSSSQTNQSNFSQQLPTNFRSTHQTSRTQPSRQGSSRK